MAGELRARGMPAQEYPIGISAIFRNVAVNPHRSRHHILDLVAPIDRWLQAIVDDGHANTPCRIEPADVAINIRPTHPQALVARVPISPMHKNKNPPIRSG